MKCQSSPVSMVQADTWQSKQFCWRSRKCRDIRFAVDLQEWSSTIQHANLSDQRQDTSKKFNILILYVTQPSC